jgi:hypothetical protein
VSEVQILSPRPKAMKRLFVHAVLVVAACFALAGTVAACDDDTTATGGGPDLCGANCGHVVDMARPLDLTSVGD